jgi:hypothetical protein
VPDLSELHALSEDHNGRLKHTRVT